MEKYTSGGSRTEFFNILSKTFLEYLPALAILCQSYLVVHAEYEGSDARDWKHEDIARALRQMGWENHAVSEIIESLPIKSSLGSQEHKDMIREARWWRGVLGEPSALNDSVRIEWSGASDGTVSEEIKDLLKLISQGTDIAPPEVVADAYCAIADRLGGSESG